MLIFTDDIALKKSNSTRKKKRKEKIDIKLVDATRDDLSKIGFSTIKILILRN